MMIDDMYKTKDLGVAAYLKTAGHDVVVKRNGSKGEFFYNKELAKEVDGYFKGEGGFIEFANNQRNLKAQIFNLRKEKDDG